MNLCKSVVFYHAEDHDIYEVSLEELTERIASGEASSFWIYNEKEDSVPWHVAFGYHIDGYGNFSHMAAHFEVDGEEGNRQLKDWIRETALVEGQNVHDTLKLG